MRKIAQFIVEKRYFIFAVFAALIAYCVYGITQIRVEYDITQYLPDNTDTKQALTVMADEFESFGTTTIMLKGVDAAEADKVAAGIRAVDGVLNFSFDSSSADNYKDNCAKYTVVFDGNNTNPHAVAAYDEVVKIITDTGKPFGVPTPLRNSYAETLASEMTVIIAIATAVIIAVLLFTSKSFAEVAAFPVVFVIAAVLNMGTNYWLGSISFVSNTVCIILQLALAIDYAIILCHRFTEEKEKNAGGTPKAALVSALTKAIPEIASSSLTTVSGLVALMFMQLGLGFDLGMVLAKSIICSLLTVFLFMPGVLLLLTKPMDKTRHRNLVPKMTALGSLAIKARYVFIGVFAVLFGLCAWLSRTVEFCYSQNSIDTSRPSATMAATAEMEKVFGVSNSFVVLVPNTVDADTQREIVRVATSEPLVTSALGWASIELPSRADPQKSIYLTDSLTNAELSAAMGIDPNSTAMLYTMYALANGDRFTSLDDYSVPLTSLLKYALSNERLSDTLRPALGEYYDTLSFGMSQLLGTEHDRMLFNVNAPVESDEVFALIERLMTSVKTVCPSAIFAGASMSAYDLNSSFSNDNLLITILTIAFIYLILAVTFKSWGIPLALVCVIQGAIFINFSIPVMAGTNMFFFVYLIASAIQMGATIDYAILLTNRFRALKKQMPLRRALPVAVDQTFPTVMTSGTIMSVAAFLVGFMTSDPLISSMGMTLGTGTVISVVCVLTALPAILYTLDPLLEKTVFKKRLKAADIVLPNPSLPPDLGQ